MNIPCPRGFAARQIDGGAEASFRLRLGQGYRPLYHGGARCPGCNSTNWHVGRASAECARCGTALPLAPVKFGEDHDVE